MEKYIPKPINCLLLLIVLVAGCKEQDDCRNRPVYNHFFEPDIATRVRVAGVNSYKFIHTVNGAITDTIELFNTGTDQSGTYLENTSQYTDYSDECAVVNYDNIQTRKTLFVSDKAKAASLVIKLMAANAIYSSLYWDNAYTVHKGEYMELQWEKTLFSFFLNQLEGTNAFYVSTTTLMGRTFTDVYRMKNGSDEVYVNKSSIAHVKIGNETWTRM